MFGAAEYDFWKKNENVREARKFNQKLFMTICEPLAERSTFIKPGDEVVPGIRAIDAAGHSPGLMAFHVESDGKRFVITADTMTQYVMAVQRPEWHFEMDDEKDKAVATRKRMLDMLATEKLFFASFHMPFPGIGWIDKTASGYRWVAHGYPTQFRSVECHWLLADAPDELRLSGACRRRHFAGVATFDLVFDRASGLIVQDQIVTEHAVEHRPRDLGGLVFGRGVRP